MVIVTTDSDMYYDCVLTTQDGKYISPEGRHIIIKLEVRDEVYCAEYDFQNNKFINCDKNIQQKVVPYVKNIYGEMVIPTTDEFKLGYVDCIRIFVPKHTFSESGVVKMSVCNINRDNTFKDKTQEVWSIKEVSTIKYKSYE
jgi:predicted peptidase